jgi:TPR repeat protein
MNANINVLLRNNTGNKDKKSLVQGFVVRTKIFNNIFSEIKKSDISKPEQNYLIIGQRGSGKTTLLFRIKYAIEDDADLFKWLIPVIFSEEQYNILNLENLWEGIAESLEETENWKGLLKQMENIYENTEYYEEQAFEILENRLRKENKTLIILIENLNVLFKKIGEHGEKRLREVLMTSHFVRLIGASTSYFDGIIDYSRPFYDFFKLIELPGLTKEETETLLMNIGEQYKESNSINDIIKNHPKRIESLRRLTGGVPRTISYLFQIFMDNENGKALKDLYQLVDHLTLLYKSELDQLSAQQQKIIDVIAKKWDPISAKEISQGTRIESKHVSAILKQLEKNQVIEILPTKSKNHRYRIKERFLNIWYLMRFGKKTDKEKVIWLVRFFDVWCDQTDLSKRVYSFIDNLKTGEYDLDSALDMGMTFLSCENVPKELKFNLYETTKSVLPKQLVHSLKLSDTELYKIIKGYEKQKDYKKAFEILNQVEDKENKAYYFAASWLYSKEANYAESSKILEKLYNLKPDSQTAISIAKVNEMDGNYTKAVKFYKVALQSKNFEAAHLLGHLYYDELNDFKNAKKYFNIAIEHGLNSTLICLGYILNYERKFKEAEYVAKKAIEKGIRGGVNNLGLAYQGQKRYAEAVALFEESLKNDDKNALYNLIYFYLYIKPNKDLADQYINVAIQKRFVEAFNLIANYYLDKGKDKSEAKKFFKLGAEKGNARSMHSLAHMYMDEGRYDEAEDLFIRAFKNDSKYSIFCLADEAFQLKRNDKKEMILNLIEQNTSFLKNLTSPERIEYSKILLWNDKYENALNIFKYEIKNIKKIFESNNEETIKTLLLQITDWLILLVAKGQFKAANAIFNIETEVNFKEIFKPVYYSFIGFRKSEFYDDTFKAGDELKDTVKELINKIEKYGKAYN